MSQEELSRRSGVNPKTVSRVANARTALTAETAEKLAQGLSLPVDFLANARDFLLQMDQLRALHAPGRSVAEAEEFQEREGPEESIAETAEQERERERYLEARRIVDSATRAFRDLAMCLATRGVGLPPGER